LDTRFARVDRRLAIAAAIVAMAWGLRLTVLEGFVYAWPRGFAGDFLAAMYNPMWWDGTGIMYGPVFVIERWSVNAWPHVLTIQAFALANIVVVALAFGLGLAAVRADRTIAVAALTVWLCARPLYYSFSVAANPEMLELLLLSIAWYAATRARPAVAWSAVVLAALTKVIPIVFAPLLFYRTSKRAIGIGAAIGIALVVIVGVGQHLSAQELVWALVVPSQHTRQGILLQSDHIWPTPSYAIAAGLNSAVARAAHLSDRDPALAIVQRITNVVTLAVYVISVIVTWRVLRSRRALADRTRLALAYGMFFALMPLMTLHTHPHTFVFLLPAWTAIIASLVDDANRRRAVTFGALFLVTYICVALPAVAVPVDRLSGTRLATSTIFADPIWANLGLISVWWVYAWMLS
jgi:glycosyl transferase family 87